MNARAILNSFFLLAFISVQTLPVFAATTTPTTTPSAAVDHPTPAHLPDAQPTGLSSCFDHYRFGSVPATISTSLGSAAQGSTLGFSGTLENQNSYPIEDATVYIKIFHIRSTTKDVNGPDVVDFFPALQHVTLKAHQTLPLSFTWKVPSDLQPGDYQAVTYVNSSDRFELQGLVFTDDVVGNNTTFKVVGTDLGALRFNKDSVTVGNKPFYFAAFPPSIAKGVTVVPVTAEVTNTTDIPTGTNVTWSLYYWDGLSQSHLLDTTTEEVKVHPHSSTTVTYLVKDTAHTVYYLKGDIISKQGTHSLIGVRFTRADVNEPRFNFIAIDGSTAVACVHSTGSSPADNSSVSLSVTPNVWYAGILSFLHLGTLASASFSGSLPGNILALTAPIKGSAAGYTIHATLSQNGKTIDSFSQSYSCTDLGTKCPSPLLSVLYAIIPLILLILIIAAVIVWRRRMIKKQDASRPSYLSSTPPNIPKI